MTEYGCILKTEDGKHEAERTDNPQKLFCEGDAEQMTCFPYEQED